MELCSLDWFSLFLITTNYSCIKIVKLILLLEFRLDSFKGFTYNYITFPSKLETELIIYLFYFIEYFFFTLIIIALNYLNYFKFNHFKYLTYNSKINSKTFPSRKRKQEKKMKIKNKTE